MDQPVPHMPRKGRGSVTNRSGRFETHERHAVDDGWARDEDVPPLATTLSEDKSRTIIARNTSPDVPFDRSINPYRGCEHGCVYCFARPTHAYLGLSPGLDFETKLFFKPDAARLLEAELRHPGYRCDVIAMGTNTDPYQPIERGHRITRQILEVLSAFNHPVSIVTKSNLILRDLDILAPMAAKGLAAAAVSVTTLKNRLARALEPRAPRPDKRLDVIEALALAGIPVTVMAAPMIPAPMMIASWALGMARRLPDFSIHQGLQARTGGYCARSLGSRASRRASPNRLKPNTARLIASPGKIGIQGALSAYSSAPLLSIRPQAGIGS